MSRGQSLFEVVVALAISAMIVVAIVSLATVSIRNSSYSKNQSVASSYAQQATEWLRGQRDKDIAVFVQKASEDVPPSESTTYCLSDNLAVDLASRTPSSSCSDPITGTPFVRLVKLTPSTETPQPGDVKNFIEADVIVSWTDSQGEHEVVSATSFADWRQR
jgi:type II secretory pathway pseudopilin PulG